MRPEASTTEDTESAGPSPLRLRVGVSLILLWLLPFWALAPRITHSMSGLSNPPSVAGVTTAIVVVQSHPRLTRVLGRGNRGQVDHQGLHHEARSGGHLVHVYSRECPK